MIKKIDHIGIMTNDLDQSVEFYTDVLEPFPDTVNQRFEQWRAEQEISGVKFTEAQMRTSEGISVVREGIE